MGEPSAARGRSKPVSAADAHALRLIARRTWRFFETFVTAEDHMLPPDNFQEDPKPVVAHRTSPTNLGLYLLSVVAARDFGWLGTLETVERLDATLGTMNGLERFRGHFYNWYDTRDLRPLEPKYVSSVDSGNLAGHLIALGNACREMIGRPVVGPEWRAGIEDTLGLTREALGALADDRRTQTVTRKQLNEALDACRRRFDRNRRLRRGIAGRLAELAIHADTVTDMARTLTEERGDGSAGGANEVLTWAEAIRASIQSHERDLEQLMPWANLVAARRRAHLAAGADGCFSGCRRSALASTRSRPWLICRTAARRPSSSWSVSGRRLRRRPTQAGDALARIDALLDALERVRRGRGRSSGASRRSASWRGRCSTRWSSAFSSTRRGSSSRSATGSPTAASTPTATTCSPPRRAWRASSRSPRATCRRGTGSGSGAP